MESVSKRHGPPTCLYEPSNKMFRVLVQKGKAFTSGGYGIDCCNHPPDCRGDETLERLPSQSQTTYLFIEEALFLHERGLLIVLFPNGVDTMSSCDLFRLLEENNLSLPIYLAYAHLRSQAYIVLRHVNVHQRLDDAEEHEQEDEKCSATENLGERGDQSVDPTTKRRRKLHLRQKRLNASSPTILSNRHFGKSAIRDPLEFSEDATRYIAFDMYNPNSNFRKTNPGRPNFFVAVSHYNAGQQSPTFDILMKLVKVCQGVPLRLVSVSDSGAIVVFGITDAAVPRIG